MLNLSTRWGVEHEPVLSPPGKGQGTHHMGVNWVGPSAGLDVYGRETPLPLLVFEPWTVQPTVGHDTGPRSDNFNK
jgi:hypothetical protein